jgi:branched-chain amino acid transport system ATP-binding protein
LRLAPHDESKALGFAIALATEARLLLLDEPTNGMNAEETDRMVDLIRRTRDRGATVVIVEHNMASSWGCATASSS